jgi:hypothetical protein
MSNVRAHGVTTGYLLAIIATESLLLGACATTGEPPPPKQSHVYSDLSTCFGVNTDFYFTAESYERPWLENSSAPFNFANLFDFSLRSDIERNAMYARLQLDRADSEPRIIFSSPSKEAVHQSILRNAHVNCTQDRIVVRYTRSVHGADSFGGSERTITVTLTPTNGLAYAISRREGVSRSHIFFMFPVPMKPVETWAQFRQAK